VIETQKYMLYLCAVVFFEDGRKHNPSGDYRLSLETWSFKLQGITSLCAFPKSGVTYLSFLLFYCLFSDDCEIHDLERKYILDIHAYPNAQFGDPLAPRLIKSHFPYIPSIPAVRLTTRAIYLIRHPIDVMMSAWDFDQLIKGGVRETPSSAFHAHIHRWLATGGVTVPAFGSWVQHVRSWLGQPNIPLHLVTYENLVDEPERELRRILEFLDIDVSAKRQGLAIERSSMKSMAAFEEKEVKDRVDGVFFRNGLAGYAQGRRFINKAYRNCYQTVLSPEERIIADRTFGVEIDRYFGTRS
jgi:hypothetical protein